MQNLTNLQYHADRTHLSSSALKLLLKSPEAFYEQYILNMARTEQKVQFTEGSLTHALLLEPHTVATDYAVFTGLRRAGAAYEAFAAQNVGKSIITTPQMLKCERLATAAKSVGIVNELLSNGAAEHTLTSSILDVPVKCRADYINFDKSYIVDVKTTALPTDIDLFRHTVTEYAYDLSAALYAQIAFDNFQKLFDFYWVVLSKDDFGCAVYKASSSTLSNGSAQVTQALVKYKKCLASGDWTSGAPTKQFVNNDYEILEV